jgi:hypothetical protein
MRSTTGTTTRSPHDERDRLPAAAVLLDDEATTALVEAAAAGPSVHNSQPWQFAVGPRHVDVFADPDRHLRVADGSGRSLLISCGAALFNLRVAADHLGFHPRVRLLPTEDDPTHVARVEVDHRHGHAGSLEELYPAVWSRRTNRFPFWDRRIPRSVLSRLHDAVTVENAVLRIVEEPAEIARLVSLLHDGDRADFDEARAERAQWVGTGSAVDGIPLPALGPRPADLGTPFRDLGPGAPGQRPSAHFEGAPTLAVLSTLRDAPADWVRAGQALERALLVATAEGVSASFMNQPLEHHDLRWQVRSPLTGVGTTQMILRLGYGPPVPATPRRPVAEVLRRV